MYAKPEKEGKKPGSKEGRPSREEIIKKFDKDGDGKLNDEEKAEVRKTMAERSGGGRKLPPFLMKKFDKDGDGELNDEEKAEARKAMEERRKEMIEKFDKDGDGKLNDEERKAAMAARPNLVKEENPKVREKRRWREKEERKKGKEITTSYAHNFNKMPPLEAFLFKNINFTDYSSPQATLLLIRKA